MAVQSYPVDIEAGEYIEVGDAIRIDGALATYYGTCTGLNEATERMEVRYFDEIRGKFLEHIWVDSEIVYIVLKRAALEVTATPSA